MITGTSHLTQLLEINLVNVDIATLSFSSVNLVSTPLFFNLEIVSYL
jgi:hypothetical protein